jgi:outer membrane protein assembly factor BamA
MAILAYVVVRELPESAADAETRASRPQEIQSVAIDGYGLPMADLRAALASHAGDQLDSSKLETDRTALETALVARGYLSAKVSAPHVMFDSNGGAFITFAITQGPLFHIRSIAVTGATARDAGIVTIAKGEVVRSDRLERARDAMSERLFARGKAASAVSVNLAPDEAAATVDVVLAAR